MSAVSVNTVTIDRRDVRLIERGAIQLGTALIVWSRRRANRRRAFVAADRYRVEYAECARTASAIARQQLLP